MPKIKRYEGAALKSEPIRSIDSDYVQLAKGGNGERGQPKYLYTILKPHWYARTK